MAVSDQRRGFRNAALIARMDVRPARAGFMASRRARTPLGLMRPSVGKRAPGYLETVYNSYIYNNRGSGCTLLAVLLRFGATVPLKPRVSRLERARPFRTPLQRIACTAKARGAG
jgi:hypothetical protein